MDIFFLTLSLVNSTFIANPVSECLGPSLSYPGDGIHLLALNEGRGLIRVGTVDGRYPIRNARTLKCSNKNLQWPPNITAYQRCALG